MAAQAEALGARDKEKLKEKLAFLQREYRKTFRRLQRAERAERVKSHVKKTVAEQNHLLLQAAAEDHADSPGQMASEATTGTPSGSFSETKAVKTPLVTFNLEHEVFSREGHLPERRGSEGTDGEHKRILGGAVQLGHERKSSRLSRSRRKGQPRVASEGGREVACDRDKPGHEGASPEGPQSPGFLRHSSSFELDQSISRKPSVVTAKQGSSTETPVTPQLEDLWGPLVENVVPGVLSPLPSYLLEKSQNPSLEHPWKEGIFATSHGSAVKDRILLADIQDVSKKKEREGEDEEDLCGIAPCEIKSENPQEQSPFGEPQSSRCHDSGSPAIRPGKAGLGCEAEVGSPLLGEVSPVPPTASLLDSCTVVEGLLFPVEYYVRTTRRMSSCQREPNLAAVIQSQLGKRRRSQRASLKDRGSSPTASSQGPAASPPDVGQESRSGSPFMSNESPGPGEGTPQSRGLTQWSRRGRRKARQWSKCRVPSQGAQELSAPAGLKGNGSLAPSNVCRSEPQEQAENQGCSAAAPAQRRTVSLHQSEPSGASLKHEVRSTSSGRRGSGSCAEAPEPLSLGCLGIPTSLKWLPSDLAPQEFYLPADEFGLLQSEKVHASGAKLLEIVGTDELVERLQRAKDAGLRAVGERPGDILLSAEDQPSEPSPSPPGLHTSKLLLSPAKAVLEGGSAQLESQVPTPLFPVVGATPASQDFWDTPQQARAISPWEPSASILGTPMCGTEEERCRMGTLCPEDERGASQKHGEAVASPEARQELAAEPGELREASANQHGVVALGLAPAPSGLQGEANLQMTSKLKNSAGSCSVDASAVWWEAAGFTELCIVTACETSVALWRRLDSGCWETVHTWSFAEVPVFQLIPLPGAQSVVGVALGGLEIAELRLLFHSLGHGCLKQLLLKAGNIKAVLGLSSWRLVCSCDGAVEVISFPSAGGSCTKQDLFPPEETTLAFAAVDGVAEALVGLTAANCVVVWNLNTRQLLCRMPLGYAYPVAMCHQAYSDSGLLFVVLSHPCAKESESCGGPAFQVVAFNPKTARSARVMVVSLPPRLQGRLLEGDVRDASAAAVLTSGAIAVWDLLGGECTALLPARAEGSWSLVRWSVTDKCLLAGQTDGSVCVYSYAAKPCSGPEMAKQEGQSSWACEVPCQGLMRSSPQPRQDPSSPGPDPLAGQSEA